jgi:homoserine O-succinyltransferase
MTVWLEGSTGGKRPVPAPAPGRKTVADADARCLTIGLVNNMPDTALESTERQFTELLDSAATDIPVRLRLFALPQVPRGEAGLRHVSRYGDIGELWTADIDGLIVTGTEPQTPSLADEPYWTALTQVIDWAEDNAISTIWSCLAAHAAVLHIDGIARRPLAEKRFGLFECAKADAHPLMHGVPPRMHVPHSRFNELPEDALRASNYKILTGSREAGVDTFVKQRNSLALFFQGHPEYDALALFREYRRDVGRYLRRQRETYPPMPHGYFDEHATAAFSAFRECALADRGEALLEHFPSAAAEGALTARSATAAVRIYANWLSHLWSQRSKRHGLQDAPRRARRQSMIPKSVQRFSDKIMLK